MFECIQNQPCSNSRKGEDSSVEDDATSNEAREHGSAEGFSDGIAQMQTMPPCQTQLHLSTVREADEPLQVSGVQSSSWLY
jgi:hypothetical protein